MRGGPRREVPWGGEGRGGGPLGAGLEHRLEECRGAWAGVPLPPRRGLPGPPGAEGSCCPPRPQPLPLNVTGSKVAGGGGLAPAPAHPVPWRSLIISSRAGAACPLSPSPCGSTGRGGLVLRWPGGTGCLGAPGWPWGSGSGSRARSLSGCRCSSDVADQNGRQELLGPSGHPQVRGGHVAAEVRSLRRPCQPCPLKSLPRGLRGSGQDSIPLPWGCSSGSRMPRQVPGPTPRR